MRTLAFIIFTLAISTCVNANVGVLVDVGWEGHYRPNHWNPIYITTTSPTPREVQLDLYAPTDTHYAMRFSQEFPVNPSPRTSPLLVPFAFNVDEVSLQLRDPDSAHTIPTHDQDNPAQPPRILGAPVNIGEILIGVSGTNETHSLLAAQFHQPNVAIGFLPQRYLPTVAPGYDPLDLLILSAPDFERIDPTQQKAILEWIQSGGTLLVLAGIAPLPENNVLLDALPCKFGGPLTFNLTQDQLKILGLSPKSAHFTGRATLATNADARLAHPIPNSNITAARRWLGFGQIIALNADVSAFVFTDHTAAQKFWRSTLAGGFHIPNDELDRTTDTDEQRRTQAADHASAFLSSSLSRYSGGGLGWGPNVAHFAIALCAILFVIGPLDSYLLKARARPRRTRTTTIGWMAFLATGGVAVASLLNSNPTNFRTLSIVDESDGLRVAQLTRAIIDSPHPTGLKFDPQSWWRPAADNENKPRPQQLQIDVHQDYRGNQPAPTLINAWHLHSLEGQTTAQAPGMIYAKLSAHGNTIEGTILNQSAVALTNVTIQTHSGIAHLTTPINPGATLPINAKLGAPDTTQPTTQPTLAACADLAITRSNRVQQLLDDRQDAACITAEFQAPPQEVKLDDAESVQQHTGLVRSLTWLR